MRTVQTSLAMLVFGLLLGSVRPSLAASYAPGKAKRAPGAELFEDKTVLPIRIEISSNEMAVLRRDDRQDVRATVWEGDRAYRDVGLHVKGAAGSRRNIDDRPALTLNFQKFTPDQRFHGLRKIHLNNSVQDPTYLSENVCGDLYRKAGIATPRVSYAMLELNGRKRGLYVLKEGFTKELLGMFFKNTEGNLYDGGFLKEITDQLERDLDGEGDVRDWSDLKALAKAAQIPEASERFDELKKVLDVDRFATYAALQILTWDWDGYLMNRNNYRVYHDVDAGRMVFLPHGMDQMFWEVNHFVIPRPPRFNSLVARAFIETPEGKKLYRERFGQVFTNVFELEALTNKVNTIAALLRPYVGNTNEYNNRVVDIRNKIVAQHANFQKRLTEPEPKPVVFTNGIASVTNWTIPLTPRDPANTIRDRVSFDGRQTLHVQTTNLMTNTMASWRAGVLLGEGIYRFEAVARCAGVVPTPVTMTNDHRKGVGAGIRHSGTQKPRVSKLVGDMPWQKIEHCWTNKTEAEVELLCELRATAGEVWFDLASLRLVKVDPASLPPPPPPPKEPSPAVSGGTYKLE